MSVRSPAGHDQWKILDLCELEGAHHGDAEVEVVENGYAFFVMKYLEFWDGESSTLATLIEPARIPHHSQHATFFLPLYSI